jgi:PAS domain S-box-containing protein
MLHKLQASQCLKKPLYLETLKYFIPGLLLLTTAIGIHYLVIAREQNLLLAREESLKVEQTTKRLEQQILQLQADTLRFAQLVERQTGPVVSNLDAMARQFRHIMAFKPQYAQVRFIAANGVEQVRLERTASGLSRQAEHLLQDKSHRPYFQKGMALQPGNVYLSALNFNVEKHRPQPNNLTLRMATPVSAKTGEKVGLLVINYNGNALLEELLQAFEGSQSADTPFGTFHLGSNAITVKFTRSDNQKIQFTLLDSEQTLPAGEPVIPTPEDIAEGQQWQSEERLVTYSSLSLPHLSEKSLWWLSHTIAPENGQYIRTTFWTSSPIYAALFIIMGIGSRVQAGHRLAVRQLQEERLHQLTRIVEQSPSAIMLTDSDARIFYTNPAFTRLTGYQSDEVKGRTPAFLQSGRTSQEQYRRLWNTLKQGEPWHGEFHNRSKDGSLFWEAALIFPIRHPWSRQTCYVAIKQDISREKALQEELQQETLARLHEEQLAKIGRMANMIAHDLRNPLSSIKMSLQMAQRRELKSTGQPAGHGTLWELALGQVKYMERILEDILNYSSQDQLHLQELDTNNLLISIVDEMREPLLKAKVTVNWSLAPQLPAISADPVRLRQVFQNLLGNALQATETGPDERVIAIESRFGRKDQSPYLMVTITNTGNTLDSSTRERAFEPFFTTRAKGTGLGLAIVKKHVNRHGGDVALENTSGGVRVSLTLPLSAPAGISPKSSGLQDRHLMHELYAANTERHDHGAHSDH